MDLGFLCRGTEVEVDVTGVGTVRGTVASVGHGWFDITSAKRWIVPWGAVECVLATALQDDPARDPPVRVGRPRQLGHVLRELGNLRCHGVVYVRSGARRDGVIGQGSDEDIVELVTGVPGVTRLIPLAAVAAVVA